MSLELHAVSTTVSCQVSGGDGHVSAEVDSRAWGWNGGRTTFYPDDECYVIVYFSNNVTLPSEGRTSYSGVSLKPARDKAPGWNLKREGISFSTPIAQASKPLPAGAKNNSGTEALVDCRDPCYLKGTTVIRLKKWTATGDPIATPPYGFIMIEYTPVSEMWVFGNLKRNPNLINTEIHGLIWAYATPMHVTSTTWTDFAS